MPLDSDTDSIAPRIPLRAAMLDLMSREAGNPTLDEAGMRAALRMLVLRSRDRSDDLWEHYHGGRAADACARTVARFRD
jgi:hypothetical protein